MGSHSKTKLNANRNRRISIKKLTPSLKEINQRAAGIDVGSTEHYAAVPAECCQNNVKCFGTFTADLQELADWFNELSTGTRN